MNPIPALTGGIRKLLSRGVQRKPHQEILVAAETGRIVIPVSEYRSNPSSALEQVAAGAQVDIVDDAGEIRFSFGRPREPLFPIDESEVDEFDDIECVGQDAVGHDWLS